MRQLSIVCHHEDGSWWAESEGLPGFSAAAETLDELIAAVREGVHFYLDGEVAQLLMFDDSGAALNAASVFAPRFSSWWRAAASTGVGVASVAVRQPQSGTTLVPATA